MVNFLLDFAVQKEKAQKHLHFYFQEIYVWIYSLETPSYTYAQLLPLFHGLHAKIATLALCVHACHYERFFQSDLQFIFSLILFAICHLPIPNHQSGWVKASTFFLWITSFWTVANAPRVTGRHNTPRAEYCLPSCTYTSSQTLTTG